MPTSWWIAVATVCLLSAGCSEDLDLDGLEEIGTTGSGATVYATRLPDDRIDVRVVVDGEVRCNASGPSVTTHPIATCDESSQAGTVYLAPLDKARPTPDLCERRSGAGVPGERVVTPGSWDFDLVVSLSSEVDAFVSPCSALPGRQRG